MAQIISATTTFSRAGVGAKRAHFLYQAHDLLYRARQEAGSGDAVQAVEYAYRAALRTAGAWVVSSPVGARKRLPSSAWDRLALVGGEATQWVGRFKDYSRLRSRLVSGLEEGVDPQVVVDIIALVAEFIYEVEDGQSVLTAA